METYLMFLVVCSQLLASCYIAIDLPNVPQYIVMGLVASRQPDACGRVRNPGREDVTYTSV